MEELFPSNPPGYLAKVLHGYADNEVVDDDLTVAGFTDAIYTTVDLPYAAASAHDAAIGYCLGTPLRYGDRGARTDGEANRRSRPSLSASEAPVRCRTDRDDRCARM